MPLDQLRARNELVNWPVAPTEYELNNYDEAKIKYRLEVETMINRLSLKSLKKKTFYTISTNVLCPEKDSRLTTIDPIDRDIYMPLEIAIAKWSIHDAMKEGELTSVNTKVWMMNPGEPPRNCRNDSNDHKKKHKIYFDSMNEQNPYIETDLSKVLKEINSYTSPDRTVFSMNIKKVRQDLGCLKWLNRQTGYKTKPFTVLSVDDLYVCMIRKLNPEMVEAIGHGIARHRLDRLPQTKGTELLCTYHQVQARLEDGETYNCAKEIATHAIWTTMMDAKMFGVQAASEENQQPQPANHQA